MRNDSTDLAITGKLGAHIHGVVLRKSDEQRVKILDLDLHVEAQGIEL